MQKVFYLWMIGAVVGLTGCATSEKAELAAFEPLCISGINQQIAMDAAGEVLRNMQFRIEKFDPDASYLRTRPLSGAQFFEIWRRDNASSYQATQANIHSLRRTVEMEFSTAGGNTCVDCVVHVQRLSVPEKPVAGMSDMGNIYTDSERNSQSLVLEQSRIEQMEWIELEPDTALQQRILDKIASLIEKEQAK